MKEYRFILKIGKVVFTDGVRKFDSFEKAMAYAESMIAPSADSFVDSVTFFEVREGYIHQVVYRIEKYAELSETFGM